MAGKLKVIIFFLLGLLSLVAKAQDESDYLKKGDKLLDVGNILGAIDAYTAALEINKANPITFTKLGRALLNSSQKSKAEGFLAQAVNLTTRPDDDLLYDYARALHFNHKFNEAITYYEKSDRLGKNRPRTIRRSEECKIGMALVAKPINVQIKNLGNLINTAYSEYLPFVTADQQRLYFTSRRPNQNSKLAPDNQYFEEIYQCFNRGGAFTAPQSLPEPINSKDHDACVGISPFGQTMFLYRGTNGGDIFISEKEKDAWTSPKPFPFNTPSFESSACISQDGKRLFFVSDRYGNKDIFVCNWVKGKWAAPQRLLGSVNTYLDEESPFLHSDGKTLYYSSKGPGSMGGFDIFKVELNGLFGMGQPENLGYPINTAGDDLYFTLSPDALNGYYASEKDGGFGRTDIYAVIMPTNRKAPELTLLKGKVTTDSKTDIANTKITVTDNEANEVITTLTPDEKTGEFSIPLPSGKNYGVAFEKSGHLFYSENVTLKIGDKFKEVSKTVILPQIKKGASIVLNNLFFETGKADLKPESTPELNRVGKLMKENPALIIELQGHTDNTGSDAVNIKLSQQRAESVKNFLTAIKIPSSRLQAKGYSSSKPLGDNNTEQGRALNRRTELVVIAN